MNQEVEQCSFSSSLCSFDHTTRPPYHTYSFINARRAQSSNFPPLWGLMLKMEDGLDHSDPRRIAGFTLLKNA